MFAVNLSGEWSEIPGTKGLVTQGLSGDFDEAAGTGYRTRLVRFEPGGETFEPFTHLYWEEVYILSGELAAKADGVSVVAPGYVIRPPGTPHGPLISKNGCLLVEVQYFADRGVGLDKFLDSMASA